MNGIKIGKKQSGTFTPKAIFILSAFALLTFILLYIIPYTRDDWAWGSLIGWERLSEFFADYNGRYAGNITEIILTRSRVFRAFAEVTILFALVFFMAPKGKHRSFFCILGICFILLSPMIMMNQTVIYTAGFSNYVVPTLSVIGFIRYFEPLLHVRQKEDLRFRPVHSVPIAFAAVISCLFMEHITTYLVFLAGVTILYSLVKYRKIFMVEIGFALGCLTGFLLMFSNGAYLHVLSGDDTYRSLGSEGTGAAVANPYLKDIAFGLYAQNWFFNITVCLTVFIIIKKALDGKDVPSSPGRRLQVRVMSPLAKLTSAVLIGLTVLTIAGLILKGVGKSTGFFDKLNNMNIAMLYGVILCILIGLILIALMGQFGKLPVFLAVSSIVVNLPLLVVNPVSPRCFFPGFILICVLLMECINCSYGEREDIRLFHKSIKAPTVATGILLASFIVLFIIYIPIYNADNMRLEHIQKEVAKGKTAVTINNLPHKGFLWGATPESGTKWERRYKLFYGIPEEITLVNS